MALLHSALRITMIFQLVLACYLWDTVYSATPAPGAAGGACITPNNTCTDQDLVCENTICKIKSEQNCAGHENDCVDGATCSSTKQCTCYSWRPPSASNGTCGAAPAAGTAGGACRTPSPACTGPDLVCENNMCKTKHDHDCTLHKDLCVNGATCPSSGTQRCACNSGRMPNTTEGLCAAKLQVNQNCTGGKTCEDDLVCDHDICKIKSGNDCTGHDNDCVDGATCTGSPTKHCTCDSWRTPISSNGTCAKVPIFGNCTVQKTCQDYLACDNGICRIRLNQHCETREDGHSPCIQPDATLCSKNVCQCNENYQIENDKCQPRILVGQHCQSSSDNSCVSQATCKIAENNIYVCTCSDKYYGDNTHHCKQRVAVGEQCHITEHGETPCVEGALCDQDGSCQCAPYQYRRNNTKCDPVKKPGDDCSNFTECMDHAVCNTSHLCDCPRDRYFDPNFVICQLKKPAGSNCSKPEECVENAACKDNHVCVCDTHYYEHNRQCFPREELGHQCDVNIPNQCLINGECVNELCQCNNNSYKNEDISCPLTLGFNETCNWENSDPRQCVSNTSCIFRASDNKPVCGCDIDHFFNGLYCIKRAKAGETCPYDKDVHFGLDQQVPEINRQCVDNADCNHAHVCECKQNYYDRAGYCPHRIAVDHICDPWRNYPNQCVNDAQCLYGKCVHV